MRRKLLLLYLILLSGFSFAQTIQLTNGGSTSTSGTTGASPISAYFEYMRFQVVYTAAELNAAGVTGPKTISQLGWYVSTAPTSTLPSYKIRMANTTATNSATNNTASLTEVYSSASYAPVAGGFDMLTLNGSFVWDGTSNVLVDVCYGAAVYASPYGELRTYAATTSNGSRRVRCDACGSQCATATNTANTFKPQVSLTFVAPPSCLTPTGLAAAPSSTSAALSWNTVSGATGYEWAVTTSATPPASGTATTLTSVPSGVLTAATNYYLHVRGNCGGSFSAWATIAFTTTCSSTGIPYSENFDGVTAPAIPTCITVQNVNGNNAWGNYSTPTAIVIGAPNSMVYPYNTSSGADDWFYLQGLNLTGGTSYRLTFNWKSNPSYPERFEVKYGTSPAAASMSSTLYTNASAASSTVVTEGIDFTPGSTGVYYIGFHCYSAADQDFLAIDDVTVDVSPSCPNPSGLAIVGTSGTTANLNWNVAGSATGYEWDVSTSNTPPGSGTAVGTNTAPVTGLAAGTQYYAHVRTVCAGPSYSSWTTFAFGWLPNDSACGAVPLTLGGPASCTNTTAATSVGDPPMPGICSTPNNTVWYSYTPTSSGRVIFRTEIPSGSTNGLEGWVAWYTGTPCPNTTLTAVPGSACQSFGPDAGDVDSLLSPVLTAGTTYYIIIDGVVGAVGEACFSIVPPPAPPACVTNIAPADAATNVVTTPAPTFSWNSDPTATSYSVYLGTTNPPTTNLGSTASTSTTITGLLYNTTYYWYVVPANVAGDATGCVANVTSFTTAPPPANCVPLSTNGCTDDDAITLFRLKGEGGGELNINTGLTCTANAYVDTTDHATVIDLARGKSYWGQAQSGTTGDYLTLWLDANDNGIYENSERLLNNLPISSTGPTNLNLFIPAGTATGNHTLRARLVYYGTTTPPTAVTDPCSNYAYSETEDYKVNITSAGSTYAVSSYASAGSCYTGGGDITIDAASNNNGNFVPLVDSNNALIAQLYPQNNNLGRVSTSYYKHNGAVRQDAGGRYYLDRNITITVGTQPASPYNLRLYFQNAELNALIAQPGSGVTSIFDLNMTKNGDGCLNAIGTGGTGGVAYAPTGFGSISGDRFLDFTNLTSFSSFYLHGGSVPVPVSLVNFMAQRVGKINKVTWSTSQEINTSYFVIERSNDGQTFTEIGRVNANGNSNTTLTYNFTDNNPVKGINYYRLRIVDRDNSAKNSAIRSVRNEGIADIAVYPNPVNDIMTVNIDADKPEKGALFITDVTGKVILTKTITVAQGNNKLPINTAALASGAYIIKVQLNDDIVVRKFNKQ